jgi:ABC-type sugar transport system ATPase subunit
MSTKWAVKESLRKQMAEWIEKTQDGEDRLEMFVSESLAEAMTTAAWAVVQESKQTQDFLKREHAADY